MHEDTGRARFGSHIRKQDSSGEEADGGDDDGQYVPIAHDRALVPWRGGLFAQMESWIRVWTRRFGTLFGTRAIAGMTRRRGRSPSAPVVQDSHELDALREENALLRLRVACLEQTRRSRPGIVAGTGRERASA